MPSSSVATVVYQVERDHTTRDRIRNHVRRLLTGRAEAAKVRLFGTRQYLLDKWHSLRHDRKRDMLQAQWKRTTASLWGNLISGAFFVGAFVLVTYWIMDGNLTVGNYVTVTTGAIWFQDCLRALIRLIRTAEEESHFVGDLFEFLDAAQIEGDLDERALAFDPSSSKTHDVTVAPCGIGMALEAYGVSFTYPTQSTPVIHNVNVRIEPGEKIAIVGDNGAGKTTLVKLLVGLYLAESGEVTIDGEAVSFQNAPRLRQRIAPVFQDYATYHVTARENIAFGDVQRLDDATALQTAATKADVASVIAGLPDRFDAFLGKEFGEVDLSGGQWQRIALARAFFRGADLLVLDEPTAALDPKAELALFERFAELVEGRTAIMVSHRLGITRLADRILVMSDGRIVESGTHEELLALDGKYAAFFRTQAQWYQ